MLDPFKVLGSKGLGEKRGLECMCLLWGTRRRGPGLGHLCEVFQNTYAFL